MKRIVLPTGNARGRLIAVAAVIVVALVAVVVVLATSGGDQTGGTTDTSAANSGASSPYDLTEVSEVTDLDSIKQASLVSILLVDESGKVTSYGVSPKLPATQKLMEAIRAAQEAESRASTTIAGGTPSSAGSWSSSSSTITFVLPNRQTLTFALDLENELISRGGLSWHPDGDLRALVEAATSQPR